MVDKNKNNNKNNSSNSFVFGLWPQTKTAMCLEEHGKRRATEMVERIKRPQFEPTTFQFKDW